MLYNVLSMNETNKNEPETSPKPQQLISFRIDPTKKIEFENFCKKIGTTPSTALNIFINKTIAIQRIPFEISSDDINKLTNEQKKYENALQGTIIKKIDQSTGELKKSVDTLIDYLKETMSAANEHLKKMSSNNK